MPWWIGYAIEDHKVSKYCVAFMPFTPGSYFSAGYFILFISFISFDVFSGYVRKASGFHHSGCVILSRSTIWKVPLVFLSREYYTIHLRIFLLLQACLVSVSRTEG